MYLIFYLLTFLKKKKLMKTRKAFYSFVFCIWYFFFFFQKWFLKKSKFSRFVQYTVYNIQWNKMVDVSMNFSRDLPKIELNIFFFQRADIIWSQGVFVYINDHIVMDILDTKCVYVYIYYAYIQLVCIRTPYNIIHYWRAYIVLARGIHGYGPIIHIAESS